MHFVSVRELRTKTADIWRQLLAEKEMVLTSNGRPIAFLCSVSEEKLEETLSAIRKARATEAVFSMQTASVEKGKDKFSQEEIAAEIAVVRKKRKK